MSGITHISLTLPSRSQHPDACYISRLKPPCARGCLCRTQAERFLAEALRTDKEIALAAVAKDGGALEYVAEALRADKDVALAAVTQNGSALRYVAAELQQEINLGAASCRVRKQEVAEALLRPCTIQLEVVGETVACYDLAGKELASLAVDHTETAAVFRERIALQIHAAAPSLQIVFPSGDRLRDLDVSQPMRDLLLEAEAAGRATSPRAGPDGMP